MSAYADQNHAPSLAAARLESLQTLQQLFSFLLISWFAEKCEHVLLIALYAGLVERIYA